MENFLKHLALFGLLLFNFLEVTQSTADSPLSSGGFLQKAFAKLLKPIEEAEPTSPLGLGGFAKWTNNFIKKWVPQAAPPITITPDTSLLVDKTIDGGVEETQRNLDISHIEYNIFNTTVNCTKMVHIQPKLVCGNKTELKVDRFPLTCHHMTVDDENTTNPKHECSELKITLNNVPIIQMSCMGARFYKNESIFCETASIKTSSLMQNWEYLSIINGELDYMSMSEKKVMTH